MTIAIIGNGNVGSALEKGLTASGHKVLTTGHDAEAIRAASKAADAIVLAVPFPAVADVVREAGGLWAGKTIIDDTNALTDDMQLALGHTTSGAEELQRQVPDANVAKAFNTVFAQHMGTGQVAGTRLTTFVAGDGGAKAGVIALARQIGFGAVDAGPLQNARLLEPLGILNIQLAYVLGLGPDIGFELHHRP